MVTPNARTPLSPSRKYSIKNNLPNKGYTDPCKIVIITLIMIVILIIVIIKMIIIIMIVK